MAPSKGTKGVSLSSTGLLYSPMVTNSAYTRTYSAPTQWYFDKALSGQFVEAQTRVVELEDIHPLFFKIFVAWLYSGKLTYEPSDPSTSSHDEFSELNAALDKEIVHTGDRLDAPSIKRLVLDTIVRKSKQKNEVPYGTVVIYAYANTPRRSPLRQLLVHLFAYGRSFPRSHNSELKYLPAEFLAAVMIMMGRRLPSRQCDSCYDRALKGNELTSEDIDDVNKEEDQAPYDHNLCFYHEHKDEEEKNACQAAREEESDTDSSFDTSSDTSSDVSD